MGTQNKLDENRRNLSITISVAFIERKWFVFHPICLFAYSQSDLWINARFDFDFETKMVTLLRYLELLES